MSSLQDDFVVILSSLQYDFVALDAFFLPFATGLCRCGGDSCCPCCLDGDWQTACFDCGDASHATTICAPCFGFSTRF